MNVGYIKTAFNYFLGNTHSRGTCRRRGISWTGSTDTGSCSAGSQDTSRLASSGTRFASGCSVGRNPEDRSKILVIGGRFAVISEHAGGSEDITRNNETEEVKGIWEICTTKNCQMLLVCNRAAYNFYSGGTRIKFRSGQRNVLTETLRRSSMPIPANSNTVSLIKQLPFYLTN